MTDDLAAMAVERGPIVFCLDCNLARESTARGGQCAVCGSSSVMVEGSLGADLQRKAEAEAQEKERGRFLRRGARCTDLCSQPGAFKRRSES